MNLSKILSYIFLSFSTAIFLIIIYRAEIHHSGQQYHYYFPYYVISLVLVFLSILSFFLSKNFKINASIVVISTLFSLYLIEGYLTYTFYSKFQKFEKVNGKKYDNRSKFEILQDFKKEDPKVVLQISPSEFLKEKNQSIFPLASISNRKTIYCNENGYYSVFKSDRFGFNNPDSTWNSNKVDYLLIGDSFTHGACVNEPDSISGNLKKFSNLNKVLNLGQPGVGPLIELAILREYISKVNTKRVLWIYYEANDLTTEIYDELKNPILQNYFINNKFSQNLINKRKILNKKLIGELEKYESEEKDKLDKNQTKKIKWLYGNELTKFGIFKNFIKLYYLRVSTIIKLTHKKEIPPPPFEKFKKIIKQAKDITEKNNAKFYFVYIPDYHRYQFLSFTKNLKNYYFYEDVLKIVSNLNIPIIDINKEILKNSKDPLSLYPFRSYGHFNKKGYQFVADILYKKIQELEK